LPVAIPSLTDIDWISMAIRFEQRITPQEKVAELRPAGDVGGEVTRINVGHRRDERRPQERPECTQTLALSHE